MKNLIKKILKESDWDWAEEFGTEVSLKDYIEFNNINLYSEYLGNSNDLIGLKVRISENSRFYDVKDEDNPVTDVGAIRYISYPNSNLPISVYWPSLEGTNSYSTEDLIIVSLNS